MNRCPRYTSPGTGPYDTAHGASIAPGAWNASLAARADAPYAAIGSSPSRSPSSRSPTSSIVFPRASSPAQKLPLTMWLTSSRTSQPSHGVFSCHWSSAMPATYFRVCCKARSCRSGRSNAMFLPLEQAAGRRRDTPPAQPVHEDPRAPVDGARPEPRQRRLVDGRRVPDVRLELVGGIVLGFGAHERVARHLGYAGGGRNGETRRIAAHDGGDPRAEPEVVVVAVEDDAVGLVPAVGKLGERTAPGRAQRCRHAERIALLGRRVADPDGDRPSEHPVGDDLPLLPGELLGVAHAPQVIRRRDERRHRDGPGPGARPTSSMPTTVRSPARQHFRSSRRVGGRGRTAGGAPVSAPGTGGAEAEATMAGSYQAGPRQTRNPLSALVRCLLRSR